jgi:hypothetical protein
MQPKLSIRVELAALKQTLRAVGQENLPHTSAAVGEATELAQREWMHAASGVDVSFAGKTFRVRRRTGAYARSIQDGLEYPADGEPLRGRVTASSDHAEAIERGSPARDMKDGLLAGPRARISKTGQRYTIIPFRHNTPTASATGQPMPAEVYKQAKKLAYTQVVGTKQEKNADGKMVTRNVYSHGGQLNVGQGIGWRSRIQPQGHEHTHAVSIFHGMVRMGSPKQSSFMTFRVVSEASPPNSWWSPAIEPRPVSEAVAEGVQERAVLMVRRGFELDLQSLGE